MCETGGINETDLSTEKAPSSETPRLPQTHELTRRTADHRRPARQRTQTPGSLRPLATLRSRADFKRVLSCGRRRREGGVTLYWALNSMDNIRYGVSVKSAVGKAVIRNRVRRWTRELLRSWLDRLIPGVDLVVLVISPSAARDFSEFSACLDTMLSKAGLLQEAAGA